MFTYKNKSASPRKTKSNCIYRKMKVERKNLCDK